MELLNFLLLRKLLTFTMLTETVVMYVGERTMLTIFNGKVFKIRFPSQRKRNLYSWKGNLKFGYR
jgi:hypothetical protein